MNELYERDDLPETIAAQEEYRHRIIAAWDRGEIDDDTFAREDSASRLYGQALETALEKRRFEAGEPADAFRADMYRAHVRLAAAALRRLTDWHGIDDELRRLLEAEDDSD